MKIRIIFIFFAFILLILCSYAFYNSGFKETEIKIKKVITPVEETNNENDDMEDNKNNILNDDGIFSNYYEQALEKLMTMSLDEKIAQVLLVRVPKDNGIDVLSQYQFGGYLLFARDTMNITKEDFINKIMAYQNVSKIPLIVAVDEEGGSVNRISINPNLVEEPFKSSADLYREGGLDLIDEDTRRKKSILEELGINFNLAPVVDIASENSFIYKRTLGTDLDVLNEYVKRTINISKESKVSYCLKHFPGYGDNADTHTGMAEDFRYLNELEIKDLIPFKIGIENGAEAILVNHNILVNIDNSSPASLSMVIHNILRNNMNFTGIIVTDDLYMDAIKNYYDRPVIRALEAGNDLIIINDYVSGINEIKDAINNNSFDINILDKAVLRVLSWKYYKGLIDK